MVCLVKSHDEAAAFLKFATRNAQTLRWEVPLRSRDILVVLLRYGNRLEFDPGSFCTNFVDESNHSIAMQNQTLVSHQDLR